MENNFDQQLELLVKQKDLKGIYPFLEQLNKSDKRALRPRIQELIKHYFEFSEQGNTWGRLGTHEQIQILSLAGFCCLTKGEFQKSSLQWVARENLEGILNFYTPTWFSDYINQQLEKRGIVPFRMDYEWMMDLVYKGSLTPSITLISQLLPEFLYDEERDEKDYPVRYTRNDSKLFRYPETLQVHIWHLFERETNLHWRDQYPDPKDKAKQQLSWKNTFKFLVDYGHLDRKRVLASALDATLMNFNKALSNWFVDLFEFLEPSPAEILELQDNTMALLNSPNTKPINRVLQWYKKLCLEKGFRTDAFMAEVPMLLVSETKSIVTSSLMILDKLAKTHESLRNDIVFCATETFVSNDSAIQTRTAKLCVKYADVEDEAFTAHLNAYRDLLLPNTQHLLAPFIANQTEVIPEVIETTDIELPHVISPENEIPIPQTIDDLMFLASSCFDHNNEHDFEKLPAALIQLQAQLNATNVARFEPALMRAYSLAMGDWRSGIGILDHLLAHFFIAYIEDLIIKFPEGTKKLNQLALAFRTQDRKNAREWRDGKRAIYPFEEWKNSTDSDIYIPFYQKLKGILKRLRLGNSLPVLSMPTHAPFWIAPKTLIARVHQWQEAGIPIDHVDFQLALSRVYLPGAENHLAILDTQLKGEVQGLLRYLFTPKAKPQGPFGNIAHWFTAGLTKNDEQPIAAFKNFIYSNRSPAHYIGPYTWQVGNQAFTNTRWDYKSKKMVDFIDHRKMMTLRILAAHKKVNALKDFFSFKKSPKMGQELMVYDYIHLKFRMYESFEHDIKRFISLTPNHLDPLYATICSKSLKYPVFDGEGSKGQLIKTLELMLESPTAMGPMAHLLLAGGLFCSDKTARTIAAEVWVQAISNHLLDPSEMGQIMGKHFAAEFAPLKRLTDLVQDQMLRISMAHDLALFTMFNALLLELKSGKIRGLKKLLELYQMLWVRNQTSLEPKIVNHIAGWKVPKSLEKLVSGITKK
jgi:hypothetical protein